MAIITKYNSIKRKFPDREVYLNIKDFYYGFKDGDGYFVAEIYFDKSVRDNNGHSIETRNFPAFVIDENEIISKKNLKDFLYEKAYEHARNKLKSEGIFVKDDK